MVKKTIGVLVGSLRRASFSGRIAGAIAALLSETFEVKFLDIGALTLYNQDLEDDGQTPESWLIFREAVRAADGVLFVTPEYNRSLPPVLKNALDIASRPYGRNAWSGKPGAVVSVSPGPIGGFGANHHLRQSAACLNLRLMAQPEAYIGGVAGLLDEAGAVRDERTKTFLRAFAAAFAAWME
jgi:chromate reductase